MVSFYDLVDARASVQLGVQVLDPQALDSYKASVKIATYLDYVSTAEMVAFATINGVRHQMDIEIDMTDKCDVITTTFNLTQMNGHGRPTRVAQVHIVEPWMEYQENNEALLAMTIGKTITKTLAKLHGVK